MVSLIHLGSGGTTLHGRDLNENFTIFYLLVERVQSLGLCNHQVDYAAHGMED